MTKALKIAMYSGDIPSTTFIERLIHGLSNTGHSILLFGLIKSKVRYPLSVKVIGYRNSKTSKLLQLLYYSSLLYLFKNSNKKRLDGLLANQKKDDRYSKVKYYPVLWYQPDIFHVQWAKALSEWIWVQDFGMKLVLSLRGAHINYSPIADGQLAIMYQTYFPKVDGFHAVSKAIAKKALLYGASAKKIHIVYSGLNLNTFEPFSSESSKVFQIISVGRPHWKKGYSYAIDAFKIIKEESNLSFHYTIIGGEKDMELLYQLKDLGLQHDITLIGTQDFETVKEYIKNSDLLLLPSVEEGIANVVLEAMAIETLVLSTDCGGMTEVIDDSINGFIVPIRDSQKMATTLLKIMQLPRPTRIKMVKEARKTIASQHNDKAMIEGMLGLYETLFQNDKHN